MKASVCVTSVWHHATACLRVTARLKSCRRRVRRKETV